SAERILPPLCDPEVRKRRLVAERCAVGGAASRHGLQGFAACAFQRAVATHSNTISRGVAADRKLSKERVTMMFIAMNRFQVKKGSEAEFEQVWKSRDSQLDKMPGFVEFHLLKGPEVGDYTLYSSHTLW